MKQIQNPRSAAGIISSLILPIPYLHYAYGEIIITWLV